MSYFNEAVNAIEEFSNRFRKNPWDYLYESDVQFELMQHLKKHFPEEVIPLNSEPNSSKISAVKSEYPGKMELEVGNRFDLVIIDSAICSADIFHRPVAIAIELKLNVDNKKIDDYIYNRHKCTLEKDLEKLSDFLPGAITTAGFAILCVKPYEANMEDKALEILEKESKFRLKAIDISKEAEAIESQDQIGVYVAIIGSKIRYFKRDAPVLSNVIKTANHNPSV